MIAEQGMESNETKDSMCRLVAAAIDSELGTLTVDREDALLHGPFADINLARIVVDKDTGDVVITICGSSRQMQCASRPIGILTFLSNSEERQRYTNKKTHTPNKKNAFNMNARWVSKSLKNLLKIIKKSIFWTSPEIPPRLLPAGVPPGLLANSSAIGHVNGRCLIEVRGMPERDISSLGARG